MKQKETLIGKTYLTNEGYVIRIIDYITRHNVLICFVENTSCQIWTTLQNIKNGEIKYPYHKSVYGIGYYGEGFYTARKNNIKTEQYIKWFSMFNRCYNTDYQQKEPTYIGCSVSPEFHNFQNFAKWYDIKIYNCSYPLELDKDLLVEGNKIYSPSTCCFLPKEINTAIKNKRHDKKYMDEIYKKYKNEVPFYIKDKLLDLTSYQRKNKLHNYGGL